MSKLKELRLTFRDLINEVTGQKPRITEYNNIAHTLAEASDLEKDPVKKREIREAYADFIEEKCIIESDTTLHVDGFNPYKNFQNKILKQKNGSGREALERFNLI